jgi:PKD repeat protein
MKNFLSVLILLSLQSICFAADVSVTGEITSNTTWTNNNIYTLNSFVYVKNGATLTIEPGTLIKGDKTNKGTLIITRGSKIMAQGTKNQPIVFTSSQPAGQRSYGDWGGIIILGRASINVPGGEAAVEGGVDNANGDGKYGGGGSPDDIDNSGVLSYVRIEFSGIAFQPNSEINGLTMGGVGRGTTIDHIQVSYNGDDSYEWFGGTVNAKYLIAHRSWDDDFDTDFGFSGKIQYGIVLRDSAIADQSGSNGFESDNDGTGSSNAPVTSPLFSNITVVGPKADAATSINANYRRALHLRRNTRTSVYNSIFIGYPTGLLLDGSNTAGNVTNSDLQFQNSIMAGMAKSLDTTKVPSGFDITSWYSSGSNANSMLTNSSDVKLTNPFNYTSPDFTPATGSPALTGASFSNARLTDPFFISTTFKGAMGTNDWTKCWTRFDPQNETYNGAILYKGAVSAFNTTETGLQVTFNNTSTDATTYLWDFGVTGATSTNPDPSYTYTTGGTYTITLTAMGPCGDSTSTQSITVNPTGVSKMENTLGVQLFPNPANEMSTVVFNLERTQQVTVGLYDLSGKLAGTYANGALQAGKHSIDIATSGLNPGIYLVKISAETGGQVIRLTVLR